MHLAFFHPAQRTDRKYYLHFFNLPPGILLSIMCTGSPRGLLLRGSHRFRACGHYRTRLALCGQDRQSVEYLPLSLRASRRRLTCYVLRNIIFAVIQSFSCKDTQALFEGRCPRVFVPSGLWPIASWRKWKRHRHWISWVRRPVTGSKSSPATGKDNGASESTISGEFVSHELNKARTLWKLLIIIED